jgi:predicted molibdopterin-dependent oxidoreductase YjgC
MNYHNVRTACIYCGVGCGMHLEVLDGRVVGVLPAKTHPVSEGRLCIKGWSADAFIHHPERLTRPLIRRDGVLESASWDEALERVAEGLGEVRSEHGADAVGVLSSAKCTNEENYLLQKFTRAVLGTNNIDHCARL